MLGYPRPARWPPLATSEDNETRPRLVLATISALISALSGTGRCQMTDSDRLWTGPAPEPAGLTELAVRLARPAGELALRRREQGLSVDTKSSATDLVTDADRAVEELLR